MIEHLLDENGPILIEMGQLNKAVDAIRQAIDMCNRREDAIRYWETRFDTHLFLDRILAMKGEYVEAEATF